MNPEKVVFGFFIVLSLTLNFGFFVGEIDNPDHHHVYELFAVVVVCGGVAVAAEGDYEGMVRADWVSQEERKGRKASDAGAITDSFGRV